MSKINYVVREDGQSNLISAESEWDFLDLDEILKDYPYISDSMNKEGYYIENEICSFFDELIFEDKVVGFATFETRGDYLILTECFIMPEFRGKRLFFEEICKMVFVGNNFGILQPTRNVVDLLLDYAFAKNITSDIIASAIPFFFDDFDARSTKNRELDEDEMEPSHFYDMSINSTIFVDGDEVIYHELLENDLKNHGQRAKLTDDYFSSLKEFFGENDFDGLIEELKEELPQIEFGFNEVVGNGPALSGFMQNMVDEDVISYPEAMDIKEQLTREYEAGEINDDNVAERLVSIITEDAISVDDYHQFKELLDSEDDDNEDVNVIKEFVNIIGDNDELGKGILEAMMSDDEEYFEDLILDAMSKDDKFMNDFLDLADEYGDEDDGDFFIDDDQLGLFDIFGPGESDKYKIDDIQYGKDYPKSYDLDIFRSLKNLKKHNDLIPAVIFANLENSHSPEIIMNLLINGGFVDNSVSDENWNEFAHDNLTVLELKDILRENNLKVSGNKQQLIDRIGENEVPLDEFKSNKVKITEKGYGFLRDFEWIEFYEKFLTPFDFDDFYRFYETHEGRIDEIAVDYLNEHIKIANENKDSQLLTLCVNSKKMIDKFGEDYFRNLNTLE